MRLLPARRKAEVTRSDPFISLQDWAGMLTQFGWNGSQYTVMGQSQEEIAPNFSGLAGVAYKTNGVVFACVTLRQLILSEARFAFRERRNGRPGNLFTTEALAPLEAPWPGATTGDLISRMELDASLGGNWFGTSRFGGVRTLRPDWMTLIVGSVEDAEVAAVDPEAEVVGYAYHPGGRGGTRDPIIFMPDEVAHYAPHPDPLSRFRGMSWLTTVIREIMADKAATDHKLAFYENAATPNLHVSMDVPDLEAYEAYVRKFREQHEATANAYKTLFTTAAVDVTPVGMDFRQMDFKVTQGAGETRIAAAARTPPALVGLSEGLQGSSLNSGNFEAATKSFVDMFARPEWRNMAGSLARIVPAPHSGSELWYDDRDIPALQEDIKKAGERLQAQSASMSSLITAGYDPDSVTDAVVSGDLSRLTHSGLTSVQLLPPGSNSTNGNGGQPALPAPSSNGSGKRSDDLLQELLQFSERNGRQRPIEIHNHLPELEPARVDFHEGAFVSHTTVEAAEPSRLEIAEGAFRSETTVEPARVDFHDGSIRVDAPITVEPATVEIAERAFVSETTVQPAQVHVDAPSITVEAAPVPDVNVTVERLELPEGAVNVTVEPAQVTVEVPPPPEVNVTVEAAPTPDINVTVEPAQVTVEAAPSPDVNITLPDQRPRKATAKREDDGSLTVSYDDEDTDG